MFVLATENKALSVVATNATTICFVSLNLIPKKRTLPRDAIRDFVAITYNARGALITYQASFVGLDKKFRKHQLSEFFGGVLTQKMPP